MSDLRDFSRSARRLGLKIPAGSSMPRSMHPFREQAPKTPRHRPVSNLASRHAADAMCEADLEYAASHCEDEKYKAQLEARFVALRDQGFILPRERAAQSEMAVSVSCLAKNGRTAQNIDSPVAMLVGTEKMNIPNFQGGGIWICRISANKK